MNVAVEKAPHIQREPMLSFTEEWGVFGESEGILIQNAYNEPIAIASPYTRNSSKTIRQRLALLTCGWGFIFFTVLTYELQACKC